MGEDVVQAVSRTGVSSNAALISFTIYLGVVFVLAWLAGKVMAKREFVSEYFLGSRNLGTWAFALTFAATAASGGSFMGFPGLIYTHGWVLALWIASYMIVPIVSLALLAKRLNQVARMADAVTVPEILRRRFNSPEVGTIATGFLLLFLFCYLVAQFIAGSEILTVLFKDVEVFQRTVSWASDALGNGWWNAKTDYTICLIFFALAVIVYTTYGGFRAVVWTDVMQGIVMVLGVIIMLALVLYQTGGLGNATKQIAQLMPPEKGTAVLSINAPMTNAVEIADGAMLALRDEDGNKIGIIRTGDLAKIPAGDTNSAKLKVVRIMTPEEIEKIEPDKLNVPITVTQLDTQPYASGAGKRGVYASAPGPHADKKVGFLAAGMAFSFFVFWAFGGAGQPSSMVRQMAFRDSRTLKRSIVTVSIYYSLIYFTLVVIFVCARLYLPGRELASNRIMPEFATFLTAAAEVPWLAGLVVAAPFAAVMSSVDSFLLMFSSGIVRDIYQEHINPKANEKQIRLLTYTATVVVGLAATIAALKPPEFLQILIVFATSGLAVGFLVPMALTIYWRRMTAAGVIAGMSGGCFVLLALYITNYFVNGKFGSYQFLGFDSFIWGVLASAVFSVAGALASPPPSSLLVERFFHEK